MVNVAHYCHHRRTRLRRALAVGHQGFFKRFFNGIVGNSFADVTHFFNNQLSGFLIQRLVDGGHNAELHQFLDDFTRLNTHTLGKVADGYGFRYCDFLHSFLRWSLEGMTLVIVRQFQGLLFTATMSAIIFFKIGRHSNAATPFRRSFAALAARLVVVTFFGANNFLRLVLVNRVLVFMRGSRSFLRLLYLLGSNALFFFPLGQRSFALGAICRFFIHTALGSALAKNFRIEFDLFNRLAFCRRRHLFRLGFGFSRWLFRNRLRGLFFSGTGRSFLGRLLLRSLGCSFFCSFFVGFCFRRSGRFRLFLCNFCRVALHVSALFANLNADRFLG